MFLLEIDEAPLFRPGQQCIKEDKLFAQGACEVQPQTMEGQAQISRGLDVTDTALLPYQSRAPYNDSELEATPFHYGRSRSHLGLIEELDAKTDATHLTEWEG